MEENTGIIRQRLFKTENYLGDFNPNKQGGYDQLDQVSLFGAVWESKIDDNVSAPATWDGGDIITPNTQDWKQVSGDYNAWLMWHDKPSTTGSTGDYPYNGMGRIVLKKNMVNTAAEGEPEVLVNTLTQDMFYKGEVGSRVPNANTIFVIQYDFVLGENITIPANCVLEFDGGSISGDKTITGTNTGIKAGLVKILETNVTIAGTWIVSEAYPEWFGAVGDGVTDDATAIQKVLYLPFPIYFGNKIYAIGSQLDVPDSTIIKGCHDETTSTPKGYLNGHLDGYETGNGEIKAIESIDSVFRLRGNFITIEGITINGNNLASKGINDDSNYIKSRICLKNLFIAYTTQYGINLTLYFSRIQDVIVYSTGVGIYISASTSIVLDKCFAKNVTTGYYLKFFKYSSVRNCCCDHATTAYDLMDFLSTSFDGNGCEDVLNAITLRGAFSNFIIKDFFGVLKDDGIFINATGNCYGTCAILSSKINNAYDLSYFIYAASGDSGNNGYRIVFYVDDSVPKLGCSDNAVIIENKENLVKELYSTLGGWSGNTDSNCVISSAANKLFKVTTSDGQPVSSTFIVSIGEITLDPGKYIFECLSSMIQPPKAKIACFLTLNRDSGSGYPTNMCTLQNFPIIIEVVSQTKYYITVKFVDGNADNPTDIGTILLAPNIRKIE